MSDKDIREQKYQKTNYNRDIDKAERGRPTPSSDTNPMIEKDGFLGVDDLDKIRRRNINDNKEIFL